jgi:hypothetical protein
MNKGGYRNKNIRLIPADVTIKEMFLTKMGNLFHKNCEYDKQYPIQSNGIEH